MIEPSQNICEGSETPSNLPAKRGTSCRGGAEVVFYQLLGGQHRWYLTPLNVAGSAAYNPLFDATTGVTTNDILWNFFTAHSKQ